jgi:hypothetical protein
MKTVGLRTYSVGPAEFPLEVEVTANRLPANRAIIGHPRVSRNGVLLERIEPTVVEDQAALAIRYEIPLPDDAPTSFDLTQTIDCWFGPNCPADARYVIVVRSKSGDEVSTSVRVPTLNPGAANLAFRVG